MGPIPIHLDDLAAAERGQNLSSLRAVQGALGRDLKIRLLGSRAGVAKPAVEPCIDGAPVEKVQIVRKVRSEQAHLIRSSEQPVALLKNLIDFVSRVLVSRGIRLADVVSRVSDEERFGCKSRMMVATVNPQGKATDDVLLSIRHGAQRIERWARHAFSITFRDDCCAQAGLQGSQIHGHRTATGTPGAANASRDHFRPRLNRESSARTDLRMFPSRITAQSACMGIDVLKPFALSIRIKSKYNIPFSREFLKQISIIAQ